MKRGFRMRYFILCMCNSLWNRFYVTVMAKQNGKVFYAVGVGHKPGIYETWSECKSQLHGIGSPKYKKFNSLTEAVRFVNKWKKISECTEKSFQTTEHCVSGGRNRTQKEHEGAKGDNRFSGNGFMSNKKEGNVKRLNHSHSVDSHRKNCRKSESLGNWNSNSNRKLLYSVNKSIILSSKTDNNVIQHEEETSWAHPQRRYFEMSFPDDRDESQQVRRPCKMKFENRGKSISDDSSKSADFMVLPSPKVSYSSHSNSNVPEVNLKIVKEEVISEEGAANGFNASEQGKNELCKINCNNSRNCDDLIAAGLDKGEKVNHNLTVSQYGKGGSGNDTEKEKRSDENFACSTGNTLLQEKQTSLNDGSIICHGGSSENIAIDDTCKSISRKCEGNLEERVGKALTSDVQKEEYMVPVANALEKVVNAVTEVFKQISNRVVAAINDDTSTSETSKFSKTNITSLNSLEYRKRNSFSGRTVQNSLHDISSQDSGRENSNYLTEEVVHEVEEKINICEKKIDLYCNTLKTMLTGMTELKEDLMILRNLIPKNFKVTPNEANNSASNSSATATSSNCFAENVKSQEEVSSHRISESNSRYEMEETLELKASDFDDNDFPDYCETPAKRKKIEDQLWERMNVSPDDSQLIQDIKQERVDYVSFTTDENDFVVVYTDGSCISNGRVDAKAGIGIWFGEGHPLNVSRPLNSREPTNNNAEIQAARIAIELALNAGINKLKICTDSEFLINCATKWVQKWKENGWMTGSNKPVKNKEELVKLLNVMSKLSVRWEKVLAHSEIRGNEMADQLANEGAALYVKH